ncbi:MAG TPA: hypothetical protein VHL31_07280 [Geminicoccus sp.]|jgi:hypothetical protein|uniref:AprA-related methyltransferase n=1 Tax=Geminicoccus sp. TaxID=2024832 RepID=UPI002E3655B5|nr:hypothetical protein [Geminicoccus sp.]HEX2526088.1 hypothetical protein [Geminicoccus sp.]
MAAPDPHAVAAWTKICHHCDGIAIGTTVATLTEREAFALMDKPVSPDILALILGFAPGYLQLACKLLASQGFVALMPGSVVLTDTGRAWLAQADRYRDMPQRTAQGRAMFTALTGGGGTGPGDLVLPKRGGDPLTERVSCQLRGPMVAAAMLGLVRSGRLNGSPDDPATRSAMAVLAAEGWATDEQLTPEGQAAVGMAAQYAYPICYLPTYESVSALLTGGKMPTPQPGEIETHVDRALDIDFSGIVFARNCRTPFFDLALPIFDTNDVQAQPKAVVDTGSGDGTLLSELYLAIRQRTRRGQLLDRFPLTLVGVEINEVARAATARRLASLDTPWRSLRGDIGKPEAIAASLAREGIPAEDVLHVSKSVLHNRTYVRPSVTFAPPAMHAVFVDADGSAIDPSLAYGSLAELLAAWAPRTRRHGMIAIEAHTVDPALAARHVGRSLITPLDASHGYSRQMLVEIEVHRAAVAAAGYRTIATRDVGERMVGRPLMSVDHIIPAN